MNVTCIFKVGTFFFGRVRGIFVDCRQLIFSAIIANYCLDNYSELWWKHIFVRAASHPAEAVDALPYSISIFLFFVLLSLNGIWTFNTHGCLETKMWPFLTADYHTMYHIMHRYNYGNYTILMDWLFGTLSLLPFISIDLNELVYCFFVLSFSLDIHNDANNGI